MRSSGRVNELEFVWIFGATGDLSRRKLMPALAALIADGRNLVVIGVGRRTMSREDFQTWLAVNCQDCGGGIEALIDRLYYATLDFDNLKQILDLPALRRQIESLYGPCRRSLYVLATAPEYFPVLAGGIRESGLTSDSEAALLIEKPFGYDLASSIRFNQGIQSYFEEKEIFRTDHYLGKAMIRSVMTLRFANALFDAVWCKDYIEEVRVIASETIGIEGRGAYYDESGALRDMVQNHLLQITALIAMEPPETLNPETVRKAKSQVLSQMNVQTEKCCFGQYTGSYGMKGYLEELGITEDSKTETFASLIIDVATPRWKGVPFTLVTGKRLKEKRTTVEIFMKPSPLANQIAPDVSPNRIEIKVQPEEGVQIRFNALRPSSENSIVERELDFCQSCLLDERSPEAYEKLLLDALNNDPTLFTAWDEIEQAWKLVDPLVEKVRSGQVKLWPYEAGSAGPAIPGLSII